MEWLLFYDWTLTDIVPQLVASGPISLQEDLEFSEKQPRSYSPSLRSQQQQQCQYTKESDLVLISTLV